MRLWRLAGRLKKKGRINSCDGANREGANKIERDWQVLNRSNRRTGECNRCYTCDSEYHLAPKCPGRKQGKPTGAMNPHSANKAPRPSFSSISLEKPASACMDGYRSPNEGGGNCEHTCSTTLKAGSQ